MSHISQIQTILNTLTSYTIVLDPANPLIGIILIPGDDIPENDFFQEIEEFFIIIKADTLANLEIYIKKFYECRSILPTGYKFTTAGQPIWIDIEGRKKPYDDTEFTAELAIIARWEI